MSKFLTFGELNRLSLTSKDMDSFANAARMLKVKRWKETANKGENVWIDHYIKYYPRIINPATLYLKCLRYRHICSDHFRDIVVQDPRLTVKQKNILIRESVFATLPSKLFYWFVVDILPQRPLKINFSLELLKDTLSLPFGNCVIRRSNVGNVWLFRNKEGNIIISNDDGLLAVITEDRHLWPTRLWNEARGHFFCGVCVTTAERIITEYSSICPFCGVDVCHSCAHSMRCMMSYAHWAIDRQGLCSPLVEWQTK